MFVLGLPRLGSHARPPNGQQGWRRRHLRSWSGSSPTPRGPIGFHRYHFYLFGTTTVQDLKCRPFPIRALASPLVLRLCFLQNKISATDVTQRTYISSMRDTSRVSTILACTLHNWQGSIIVCQDRRQLRFSIHTPQLAPNVGVFESGLDKRSYCPPCSTLCHLLPTTREARSVAAPTAQTLRKIPPGPEWSDHKDCNRRNTRSRLRADCPPAAAAFRRPESRSRCLAALQLRPASR